MISMANAVIYNVAMMIKSFDAFSTSATVNTSWWPKTATKEAKIIEVSIFFYCSVKTFVKIYHTNLLGVSRVTAKNHKEKYDRYNKEQQVHSQQQSPVFLLLIQFIDGLFMNFSHRLDKNSATH